MSEAQMEASEEVAPAPAEIAPSQTLYVNNLNDKLALDALKKQLYMVFSQYGKVSEVIAFKGVKGRGQAWIVYQDISHATQALRSKQGFNFYDKPLRIAFAKIKPSSVAISEKVAAGAVVKEKKRKADKATGGEEGGEQLSKKPTK